MDVGFKACVHACIRTSKWWGGMRCLRWKHGAVPPVASSAPVQPPASSKCPESACTTHQLSLFHTFKQIPLHNKTVLNPLLHVVK